MQQFCGIVLERDSKEEKGQGQQSDGKQADKEEGEMFGAASRPLDAYMFNEHQKG